MQANSQPSRGPSRVLLVIDQSVLAEVVKLTLNHGQYLSRMALTREQVVTALQEWNPHLAIVDMDVAEGAALGFFTDIPPAIHRPPIIALTRRGDLKTKLAAFEEGVDDILTIPFSPEELVARALVVMRRTYSQATTFMPALRVGDLNIDILNRVVQVGEHELHLTSLELSLLYLLAANSGRLLTRDEILDYMWGVDYAAESNVVDRHIRNLRAKLQNSWRRPRYIATVPGKGYRFIPTVVAGTQPPASA